MEEKAADCFEDLHHLVGKAKKAGSGGAGGAGGEMDVKSNIILIIICSNVFMGQKDICNTPSARF